MYSALSLPAFSYTVHDVRTPIILCLSRNFQDLVEYANAIKKSFKTDAIKKGSFPPNEREDLYHMS